MFVDEAQIEVHAGKGGDGMSSFRREKYVARGGPNGGDGGKGGDVVLVATHNTSTLYDYRHQRLIKARPGQMGGSSNKTGADGEDAIIPVPIGTLVYDADTKELLADLTEDGQRIIVAKGGRGGLGNTRFKSSTNQAPRKATPGRPGEERTLLLELKLIADIGLIGYPSVGKSTIISAISSARPKIADYPFTTLAPNLGVVQWKNMEPFVVADIPGLIEGAHEGQGLGHQFLRHVERTNLLVHVIEVTPDFEGVQSDGRDPIKDFHIICDELKKFNPELADRSQLVILNKVDLPYTRDAVEELRAFFEDDLHLPFLAISAATGENLDEFKTLIAEAVLKGRFGDEIPEWER